MSTDEAAVEEAAVPAAPVVKKKGPKKKAMPAPGQTRNRPTGVIKKVGVTGKVVDLKKVAGADHTKRLNRTSELFKIAALPLRLHIMGLLHKNGQVQLHDLDRPRHAAHGGRGPRDEQQ